MDASISDDYGDCIPVENGKAPIPDKYHANDILHDDSICRGDLSGEKCICSIAGDFGIIAVSAGIYQQKTLVFRGIHGSLCRSDCNADRKSGFMDELDLYNRAVFWDGICTYAMEICI